MESLFVEKELRLEVRRGSPDADYRCHGDRVLLLQVITNLLGNAIRFSPQQGSVVVTLAEASHEQRGGLRLSFRDFGAGIPESELDSVFDEFVQSSTTETGAGGTGLGLAICRKIIARHKGRMWAETTGQGALFHVWLPNVERTGSAARQARV